MVQIALIFTAICTLLLGVLVLLNNPRSTLFRLNFTFSVTSALWMGVNALVISDMRSLSPNVLLLVAQFITPLSLVTSFVFYLFLKLFNSTHLSRIDMLLAVPTMLVCSLSFTAYNVYLDGSGQLALGSLYPYYLVTLMFNVALLGYALYNRKSRRLSREASRRQQMTYLRIGVFTSVVPAIIFGSIVPLFSRSDISNIGPLFAIFFIIFSSIAIVKHKLFDIRFFVVRALAYLLTTGTLAMLYVAPALYLLGTVVMGFPFHPIKFAVGVLIGTIVATNFARVKKWFDGITSKIFFRDTYDSAQLLGELNKVLVSSADMNKMLHASADLIAKNIKPDFCIFVLNETAHTQQRIIGVDALKVSNSGIRSLLQNQHTRDINIIATDFLPPELLSYQKELLRNDVGIIVRLSDTLHQGGDSLGYALLGFKKSGNPYNAQDMHTLETIADAMAIAIQNALHFEEIQNFNITLQQRIIEATGKYRRANAKLKALDETKDDFISMASHQLRTPLTSVKGYLSMVLEGDAGKLTPMQRKMLDQAFVSSQRMVFLIADLLNVSRLKTGKFVIEPSRVNLAQTIADEINQLKETVKNRGLELIYDRPADFPELMIDETKIRQVIMNFIDNAIYYTPSGGKIHVSLKNGPSTVEFRVTDSGIGVPKREQPHLFTKFYRAGNARQTRPDGTGLGLFMAKKVIIAQGGAVIFDSTEGKGSTFGFIFSKDKLAVPEQSKALQAS